MEKGTKIKVKTEGNKMSKKIITREEFSNELLHCGKKWR